VTKAKKPKKKPPIPTRRDREKLKELNATMKKARALIKTSEKARDEIIKKYVVKLKKDWKLPRKGTGGWSHDAHDYAKDFIESVLNEAEKAIRAGLPRIKILWKRRRDRNSYSRLGARTIRKAQEKKGKKASITDRGYDVKTGSYHVDRWGSKDEWTRFHDITIEVEL